MRFRTLSISVIGSVALALAGCDAPSVEKPVVIPPASAPSKPAAPPQEGFTLADLASRDLPTGKPTKPRSFTNTRTDVDDLAREIIDLFETGDKRRLIPLRITKDEFCTHLWPEFPASKTPNVTCDWALEQDDFRNNYRFAENLKAFAGKKFTFVRMTFQERPLVYKTFRILMRPRVVVKTETGEEKAVDFFGPILEIDGRYKLYSFYNDD